MVTSRSTSGNRKYVAGVSIFSGRPDPTWPVSEEQASDLLRLFDASASYADAPPSAPPLGYRGAFLRDDAGNEWYAYRGVVAAKSVNSSAARLDENRAFERALLASAPQGSIPPGLLDKDLN